MPGSEADRVRFLSMASTYVALLTLHGGPYYVLTGEMLTGIWNSNIMALPTKPFMHFADMKALTRPLMLLIHPPHRTQWSIVRIPDIAP
jgi:hypothetical protein